MALHKLAARTWVNAARDKVVPAGDPEAAFLLGNEGAEIEQAEAERLGLTEGQPAPDAPEAADARDAKAVKQAEVADKAVDGPKGAKARGVE